MVSRPIGLVTTAEYTHNDGWNKNWDTPEVDSQEEVEKIKDGETDKQLVESLCNF